MPRVFVVQMPARREGGRWVEKYDLTPAEAFGELVRVLPYGNVPMQPEPTRARLTEAFRDFDFHSDHVLLLGDPVAIAQAVHVLALKQPSQPVSALKWDRRTSTYSAYLVGGPQ